MRVMFGYEDVFRCFMSYMEHCHYSVENSEHEYVGGKREKIEDYGNRYEREKNVQFVLSRSVTDVSPEERGRYTKKRATEVIIPKSNSEPPTAGVTTYSGINTDNRPKAISWKKNPSRHIATRLLQ